MNRSLALIVAGTSGFIALSYEILWYRVISYASWGLPGAFGLLLGAYLLGLAIGSRVAGSFCKDEAKAGDRSILRRLAAFAFVANVVAWLVVPVFGWSSKKYDWPPALAAVALAAALLGAILPLVAHFGIKADDKAGVNLSYVYLANIIGSGAGSLITGFVFLDLWPLQTIAMIIALIGMVLVTSLVIIAEMTKNARMVTLGGLALAAVLLVKATPFTYDRIWERLQYKANFTDDTRFKDVVETKSGVIAVTQDNVVYGGGAYDGKVSTSFTYDVNGIFRAHSVGAFHPAPKRVLMIGLATGAWAQVVANIPGVEHMTVVEINPGYLKLIAKYPQVSSLLTNPKVDIVIDDGRRWLNRHPDDRFDVMVMNTTWHWRAHATNLLSQEYFELAKSRLAPGGIMLFNTTSSDDAKKTAMTVFPYGYRIWNCLVVSDSPFTFDRERYKKMLLTMKIDGEHIIDVNDEELIKKSVDYAETLNWPPTNEGLESRESVLMRSCYESEKDTGKCLIASRVITDDNMVPEWRKVIRFQDPP